MSVETGSEVIVKLWDVCKQRLQVEVDGQQFNQWISPLQVEAVDNKLVLLAPNHFVLDWIKQTFEIKIKEIIQQLSPENAPEVCVMVGSRKVAEVQPVQRTQTQSTYEYKTRELTANRRNSTPFTSHLNEGQTLSEFVIGPSNELAFSAAECVANKIHSNQQLDYNPLFIYGDVGLGKTHLMHAIGNKIIEQNPGARVLYLHSERFVADMIKALQRNAMNNFKRYYRSLNALLIDDIQFFAGKERSQEEFFHTFNALLDGKQQIVLTSDRYPKEINGVEERLKSRFGWGLTVAVEPPDLETRVAILMRKAESLRINLPSEVAFFMAKHIQSNVRELEGSLKRVIAHAHFTGRPFTVDLARDSLKDLLVLQSKLITIENIQKTVAHYYKVKVSDLLSKRRSRSVARPRQMAMALSKEMTNHSLPEIGDAFGGRDHTTVLHACRKIRELMTEQVDFREDWKNLVRILST